MFKPFWKSVGLYGVLAFATLPLILGWVPPNRWYGFRFAGALDSPEQWYAMNALGGLNLLGGLAICVAANFLIVWKGTPAMVRNLGWINAALILASFWWVTLALLGQSP